jgi:hypothetical protein
LTQGGLLRDPDASASKLPKHRGLVEFEFRRRVDIDQDVLWYTVCIGLWPSIGNALGRDLDAFDAEEFGPGELGLVRQLILDFLAAMPDDAVLKAKWATETVTALAVDVTETLHRIVGLLDEATALGTSVVIGL